MRLGPTLAFALALIPALAGAEARFALVVGNNQGAAGRAKLWYAESDAAHLASALVEVGQFPADHVTVLTGATVPDFRAAFGALDQRVVAERARGERTLLVVYFSGHASDAGLELGADRLPYEDLRALLLTSSAEARVAVVDACDSGMLTQIKGGRPAPSVAFALPLNDQVAGVAFVASTSVGEPAQESRALEGSFFSRHFEMALRGAGDLDRDGQVTLTEAFRYAAARTVAATAGTRAGPQHPTYDMNMSGSGDVVLADLRHAEAVLALPPAAGAQYVIRGANGIVAEVPGTDSPLHLALSPGHYDVERQSSAGVATAAVDLARGESRDLPSMQLQAFADASQKGVPRGLGFFGGASIDSGAMLHENISWGAQLGVSHRLGPIIGRISFDYSQSTVNDSGLEYQLMTLGGSAAVLYPILWGDGFRLAGGVEAGLGRATQYVHTGATFSTIDVNGGGLLSLTYPVGFLRLGVDLSAALHGFELDQEPALRFTAGCMVTAGFEL